MIKDPLLRELGHLAKEENEAEQARLDERWDRLAAGTLSAEEEAELRALAAADPEAREAYEAFRPLGADFQARVAGKLAEEIKGVAEDEERPSSRILPFRPSRRAGWLTAAAVAAAAAGLLLLLRGPDLATMPPLPLYGAELSGGTRTSRGEEGPSTGPWELAPGDRFQVVLRPETRSVGTELEARCFLRRGGDLRRLETQSQVDPGGAVKMEGSIGRDLQPGDWTLWAVVGRQGELPDPADPRFSSVRGAIRQRHWIAVPKPIRLGSRSP